MLFLLFFFALFSNEHGLAHGFDVNTLIKIKHEGLVSVEYVSQCWTRGKKQFVASYNTYNNCWSYSYIQSVAQSNVNCYIRLKFDDCPYNDIVCTPTQKFYLVTQKKWAAGHTLKVGDVLLGNHDTHVILTSINFIEQPLRVYSICVKDTHTFLVGNKSLVTHNLFVPLALTAGISVPFGTSCSGGTLGGFFGPIGLVGGFIVGGLIGCMIKTCVKNKISDYTLTFDVEQLDPYITHHLKSRAQESQRNKIKSRPIKTVGDIVHESSPGDKTKGKTKQFEKPGNFDDALNDFESLCPSEIKDIGIGQVGVLPDGRKAIVRNDSSNGKPTLEIQEKNSEKKTKIRYG